MAVRAVQKNTDNSGTLGYTKSAAVGALIGYSLKYILPVTPQERDENFNTTLNEIKSRAKEAELAEVEKIRSIRSQSDAADTFIRMYDAKIISTSEINKLKNPLSDDVMRFFVKVNDASQKISANEMKKLRTIIKQIRPSGIFIGMGAAAGVLIALVNNVIHRMSVESPQ